MIKISIRIKFFIVLLAFSLAPMLISRFLMGKRALDMADHIAAETQSEMLQIIYAELEHTASSLLRYLDVRGQATNLRVRLLAKQAERNLIWQKPALSTKIYYASNYNSNVSAPPDLAFSDSYMRRTQSGKTMPMKISLEHAAFRQPFRETSTTDTAEIQRLQGLIPTFKELRQSAYWFNVGLESGVFATYPGHGYFPMRYDHRDQQWYLRARHATNEVTWTAPAIDPATRMAVLTASYPIRNAQGEFMGAASVDIPIYLIINDARFNSRWSNKIKAFMVQRQMDKNGVERLLILAQQSYDEGKRRNWMAGIEPEWMTSDDKDGFNSLLAVMSKTESGVVNLSYKGEDCFWAYASNDKFSFILIAPESVVTALPEQVSGIVNTLFDKMRTISGMLVGVLLIIVSLIAWFGSRATTKPLLLMANIARRLAQGDFSARMDIQTGDERDEVINSLNAMGPKLQERLSLRRDMELAREVQNLLLPKQEPVLSGFDISGGITFCDQTGGDYYDFIAMPSDDLNTLGIVLGDVSGHGVPSALVMAMTRGQLHSLSCTRIAPKDRIQAINSVLSRDMDGTGRFLTLFYLQLSENSPTACWVRAGHDPAIRYNPTTDTFSELGGDGLALGVLEEFEYQSYETVIQPGEVIVLATDGVWEARNSEGEMFGKKRILAIIKKSAQHCAEGIRLAIMNAVKEYQFNGQEDDIAVVVIKRDQAVHENAISFRMTNKENCFKKFTSKVEAFGIAHDLSPKAIFHLTLVLDELITNIISYGYADYDEHPIDVSLTLRGDILTLRIEDDAQPFNILEAPAPELDTPLEERDRQIGGMGVHLVKNMVQHIHYERTNGKNVLTLVKDLKSCAQKG